MGECCGGHDHGHDERSMFLPEMCTVVKSHSLTSRDKYFECRFDGKDLGHLPGQFVELSIPGVGEAPFSVSSSPTHAGSFEMVIRNVGRVTSVVHNLGNGATVGVRGPYGTSFPMAKLRGRDLLFVAGGIGLVPLRSAINYALDKRSDYGAITVLFGCTDPSQRLFVDELAALARRSDVQFVETVDRCNSGEWTGNVGVITTLFPKVKDRLNPAGATAIIVGPPVMYKFVVLELRNMGFRDADIIVSLERRMKCGVGKCGHCQINGVYVCQDGPVFAYEAIKGLVEAI